MSIKALAQAVLQVNRQVNCRETLSLPGLKKQSTQTGSGQLKLLPRNQSPEPEWQYHFCTACADFNSWHCSCPRSLDECLLTKIIEADGSLDKLRGLEVGQGVTTDRVIDEWLRSNEPPEILFKKPLWFVCVAEYLSREARRD